VIALLAAGSRRIRSPLDRRQQGLVLWGAWLLTMAGFFSVAGFFHSYYLVTLAPAIAALAAIGLVTLWHEYLQHRSPTNWRGWLLPLALVVTAIAQVHILSGYPAWSRWMAPLVLAGTIIPALGLAAARFRPRRRLRLWVPFTAAMGSLALLVAPTVWAANTVSTVGGGIPSAGPSVQSGNGGGGGPGGFGGQGGFGGGPGNPPSAGPGGGGPAGQPAVGVTTGQKLSGSTAGQALGGGPAGQMPTGGGGDNASVDSQLLNYLLKHQGSTYYLVVTSNSNSAAPYIIKTGKPVMSLGGFGGNDPILTLAQFQDLVKGNKVRYVLGGGGGGGGGQGSSSSVTHWVQTACTAVPSSSYQSTTTSNSSSAASTSGLARGFDGGSSLYDCAGA
jgi:4-amino-4-deoxy-L-arabinose transferase-like glycosyltransferase